MELVLELMCVWFVYLHICTPSFQASPLARHSRRVCVGIWVSGWRPDRMESERLEPADVLVLRARYNVDFDGVPCWTGCQVGPRPPHPRPRCCEGDKWIVQNGLVSGNAAHTPPKPWLVEHKQAFKTN